MRKILKSIFEVCNAIRPHDRDKKRGTVRFVWS